MSIKQTIQTPGWQEIQEIIKAEARAESENYNPEGKLDAMIATDIKSIYFAQKIIKRALGKINAYNNETMVKRPLI